MVRFAWSWACLDTFMLREDAPQNRSRNGYAVVKVSPLVFRVFLPYAHHLLSHLILYHFDGFGLGCDLWPDGQNFDYVQGWCDLGHGLKFGRPRETEGEGSKVWSGNVGEKSLVVVKKEWLGQSGDLITYWWQLIIEERREDPILQVLQHFPSIILLYLSSWTSSIFSHWSLNK